MFYFFYDRVTRLNLRTSVVMEADTEFMFTRITHGVIV